MNYDPSSERQPIDWSGPEPKPMDEEARPAWLKEHSAWIRRQAWLRQLNEQRAGQHAWQAWIKDWAARARARVDEALKPLTDKKL